jgi:hypothetical protein
VAYRAALLRRTCPGEREQPGHPQAERTAPARLADVPSHVADARAIAEPLARL